MHIQTWSRRYTSQTPEPENEEATQLRPLMAAAASQRAGGHSTITVGIDLGTSHCSAALCRGAAVDIIRNEHGARRSAALVAFTAHDRLLADAAKHQLPINAANTVSACKRLLARHSIPKTALPFALVAGDHGEPIIEISYRGTRRRISPEQISAILLQYLRRLTESALAVAVTGAVISVPGCFTHVQRQATREAAVVAGFVDVQLISDATAAALAYAALPHVAEQPLRNILLCDFGGGTFDSAVAAVEAAKIEILAAAGDADLGGEDLDDRLLDHFVAEFRGRTAGRTDRDIGSSQKALRRLRAECEKAKRNLSTAAATAIDVYSLHEGIDFDLSITRQKFEQLTADVFQRCLGVVRRCVADAGVDLAEIVLVGGCSRIPMFRRMIREMFPRTPFCKSLNADEAVTTGAARCAAAPEIAVADVTAFSLRHSLEGSTGRRMMKVLIPRQRRLPASVQEEFSVSATGGEIALYQDEAFVGKFAVAEGEGNEIMAEFKVDEEGIVSVWAWEVQSGRRRNGEFGDSGAAGDRVAAMAEQLRQFDEDDRAVERRRAAMNELQKVIHDARTTVRELTPGGGEVARQAGKILDETEDWMIETEQADEAEFTEMIRTVRKDMDKLIGPLLGNSSRSSRKRLTLSRTFR